MSQYTDLKNTIDANVNTNGVQSITGAVMNDVLNEIVDFAEGKQDALVSGTNIKTINGESILGSGDIEVQGGGGTVEVDMEMSDTSENAVANRVIKEYVDGFIPLCREFSDDFNNSYSI